MMMFYFTDSLRCLQELNNCKSRDELFSYSQSAEAIKVTSLCILYFKNLVDEANNYVATQAAYYAFVVNVFNSDKPINAGGQALAHQEGMQLVQSLVNQKNKLEQKIFSNTSKYIKA